MANIALAHLPTLKKTASYYVLHIVVASVVAYLVTGNLWMALTLSLLEPTVQAVAYFFHEKAWQRAEARNKAVRTFAYQGFRGAGLQSRPPGDTNACPPSPR